MLQVVTLSRDHDRAGFESGVPELDSFLRSVARQYAEKGISRTFVLTKPERPRTVLGCFTLTLCEVREEELPGTLAGRFPSHPLPAVRLARLAVDRRHRREGYGRLLLAEAIHRTAVIADQAGLVGLFVDAKDAGARAFYERFGFVLLRDQPLRLFLPRQTLLAGHPPPR